jgi:hypothetical protein
VFHVILRTDSDYSRKQRLAGVHCVFDEMGTEFFGAFAKLRKATISFVMSLRPAVRMEQLFSHWRDFHEI